MSIMNISGKPPVVTYKPGTLLVDPQEPTASLMVISSTKSCLVAVSTVLCEVYRWRLEEDGWQVSVSLCSYSRTEGVDAEWLGVPITWYPRPTEVRS